MGKRRARHHQWQRTRALGAKEDMRGKCPNQDLCWIEVNCVGGGGAGFSAGLHGGQKRSSEFAFLVFPARHRRRIGKKISMAASGCSFRGCRFDVLRDKRKRPAGSL